MKKACGLLINFGYRSLLVEIKEQVRTFKPGQVYRLMQKTKAFYLHL